jgi:hypothetical protein
MKNIPRIESKTPQHYQTLQRWIPGEPLPSRRPDAYTALERNADAGAQVLKFKSRIAPTFDDPTSGLKEAA